MAVVVNKKRGESRVELINRFRKIFLEEGVIDTIKEKLRYVKPARRRYAKKKEKLRLQRRKRRY